MSFETEWLRYVDSASLARIQRIFTAHGLPYNQIPE